MRKQPDKVTIHGPLSYVMNYFWHPSGRQRIV